jgi:hypothetical protein
MSENNKKNLVDEELENVTGGRGSGAGALSRFHSHEREHKAKVEKLSQEALKRLDPKDPLSWFQTVADVFDEKYEKK